MGLFSFITGGCGATARVRDGRLVLTLPDAQMPSIWILDLNESPKVTLSVEPEGQGVYALKKAGSGKGAAEIIALYAKEARAMRALYAASKALAKATDTRLRTGVNGQPVVIRPASRVGRFFTFFLYLWFAFYLCVNLLHLVMAPVIPDFASAAQVQGEASSAASAPQNGVPQSADDFLKNNAGKITP